MCLAYPPPHGEKQMCLKVIKTSIFTTFRHILTMSGCVEPVSQSPSNVICNQRQMEEPRSNCSWNDPKAFPLNSPNAATEETAMQFRVSCQWDIQTPRAVLGEGNKSDLNVSRFFFTRIFEKVHVFTNISMWRKKSILKNPCNSFIKVQLSTLHINIIRSNQMYLEQFV